MGNTPSSASSPQSQQQPTASANAPLDLEEVRTVQLAPDCKVYVSLSSIVTKKDEPAGQVMWCFETEGLTLKNQREIVVLLEHEKNEARSYPQDIITYLSLVYDCASKGMLVHDGGYTQLGGTFLGSKDNAGFVYTTWRTQGVTGFRLKKEPQEYLYAVLAKQGEIEWAKYMSTRLLLALGNLHRYYPCPLWGRRARSSVFNGLTGTVITRIPMCRLEGALVQKESDEVIKLLFPDDLHDEVVADFSNFYKDDSVTEDLSALTVLTSINLLNADAHLVYVPGSQQPVGICAEGSSGACVAGSFLTFLPIKEVINPILLIEDGWMVQMPVDTFWKLIAAIKKKEEFVYQDDKTSQPLFKVSWYKRSFTNPITGETITANYGWTTYGPKGESKGAEKDTVGKLCLKTITLLTEDGTMGRRTSATELAAFVDAVSNSVEKLHDEWASKKKKGEEEKKTKEQSPEEKKEEETEKAKGDEREGETKKKEEEKASEPLFELSEGQELIVQLELNPSGEVSMAGRIVGGGEGGEEQITESDWMDFVLQELADQLAASSPSSARAALPKVVEGPVSFLLHYHQPRQV